MNVAAGIFAPTIENFFYSLQMKIILVSLYLLDQNGQIIKWAKYGYTL